MLSFPTILQGPLFLPIKAVPHQQRRQPAKPLLYSLHKPLKEPHFIRIQKVNTHQPSSEKSRMTEPQEEFISPEAVPSVSISPMPANAAKDEQLPKPSEKTKACPSSPIDGDTSG
ncbi:MAG: hypothetical protein V4710_08990 [Verrucomicrobiota bacterium]